MPVTLIDHSKLNDSEKRELQKRAVEARNFLASYDPIGESMEVLAAAGIHSVRMKGVTPTGMRFESEGGAPKPPRKGAVKRTKP